MKFKTITRKEFEKQKKLLTKEYIDFPNSIIYNGLECNIIKIGIIPIDSTDYEINTTKQLCLGYVEIQYKNSPSICVVDISEIYNLCFLS